MSGLSSRIDPYTPPHSSPASSHLVEPPSMAPHRFLEATRDLLRLNIPTHPIPQPLLQGSPHHRQARHPSSLPRLGPGHTLQRLQVRRHPRSIDPHRSPRYRRPHHLRGKGSPPSCSGWRTPSVLASQHLYRLPRPCSICGEHLSARFPGQTLLILI